PISGGTVRSADRDSFESRSPHSTLCEFGEERHRIEQRAETVHTRPVKPGPQCARELGRDHPENGPRGHRGALDHPVDRAVEAPVPAAPDLDPRRTPLAVVTEAAAETRALRRLTELDTDARDPRKGVDEQRRRTGHRPAVAGADRLRKPDQ